MSQKILNMMEEYGLTALSGVAINNYMIVDQFHYGQISLSNQSPITASYYVSSGFAFQVNHSDRGNETCRKQNC
ncbi:MAG: hypothetical protein MZU97_19575 [Bacillus subtilis]|nr:hypothetical protein [Bacillus subtilis]